MIGKKAEEFISILRERTYGTGLSTNEQEGDYGTWNDWKEALIEFYNKVNLNSLVLSDDELSALIEACRAAEYGLNIPKSPWDRIIGIVQRKLVTEEERRSERI